MSLSEITSQHGAWSGIILARKLHLCLGESDYQICVKVIDSKEEVVSTNNFDTIVNADDWLNETVDSINDGAAKELKA